PKPSVADLFRFWFGWVTPVGRRRYFVHGAGLMLLKYLVDAGVFYVVTGHTWTPLNYFDPVWTYRQQVLGPETEGLSIWLAIWTLPFIWIGVSLSMRRAIDAGDSAWLAVLFFVPVFNYLLMLGLSLVPSRMVTRGPPSPPAIDEGLRSALVAVAAGMAITIPTILIAIYVKKAYSPGLFLGTPFTLGAISANVFNSRRRATYRETVPVVLLTVALVGGVLVLFALEGVVCVLMAFPIAAVLALLGAVLGRIIALRTSEPPSHTGLAAVMLPLALFLEPARGPAPVQEVVTSVEIDASPDRVWHTVVAFPELPPPSEWVFRAGVAAPLRAHLEGSGVGAIRYCEFTTGAFVEPITRWEPGRVLGFSVTRNPPPMREMSPYRRVYAQHLDGYFRATRGEFDLIPLPGGRTRLEGHTWYRNEMYPQVYWDPIADRVIEAIHRRVLEHVKRTVEAP
ncbi:MAG TPA: SRPBCC family protein, partial [Gemmatimonadales bacterium]|nr:SRPBCC family protein [Gemmatimonadales bacterium]